MMEWIVFIDIIYDWKGGERVIRWLVVRLGKFLGGLVVKLRELGGLVVKIFGWFGGKIDRNWAV